MSLLLSGVKKIIKKNFCTLIFILSRIRRGGHFEHHYFQKKNSTPPQRVRTWPSPHVWLFFTQGWPLLWQTEWKWSIWPCLSLSRKYIPPSAPVFVAAGRAYPSLCFKAMGLILIPGADCITHFFHHFFSLTPCFLIHLYLSHTYIPTKAFLITPFFCSFLSGHLALGVTYKDDMLGTI